MPEKLPAYAIRDIVAHTDERITELLREKLALIDDPEQMAQFLQQAITLHARTSVAALCLHKCPPKLAASLIADAVGEWYAEIMGWSAEQTAKIREAATRRSKVGLQHELEAELQKLMKDLKDD